MFLPSPWCRLLAAVQRIILADSHSKALIGQCISVPGAASFQESGENSDKFSELAMALLPILCFPDPRLHKVAQPVKQVDARIRKQIEDMFETMYDANGIGLAATQVDFHERLIVIDVSQDRDQPLVLINPELVWASDEKQVGEEGCLSVPGIYDGVERSTAVKVKALDENGASREIEAEGLLAICIQHEMDHLMGKVFVEYLSPLKRNRIKTKLVKMQKQAAH
jgi:peptide deformylase